MFHSKHTIFFAVQSFIKRIWHYFIKYNFHWATYSTNKIHVSVSRYVKTSLSTEHGEIQLYQNAKSLQKFELLKWTVNLWSYLAKYILKNLIWWGYCHTYAIMTSTWFHNVYVIKMHGMLKLKCLFIVYIWNIGRVSVQIKQLSRK